MRAARDRSRPRPLPGRSDSGGVPGRRVRGPLSGSTSAGITWRAANVPAARLDSLGVDAINVATNGSVAAIEQARTVLENAAYLSPARRPPSVT